jgi:serine/threonine-protein kinase
MAKSIGRYEIREELGRGGMSTVYLAFDPKLHREVALKLMDQNLTADPAFSARFEREARIVAALDHTAIVSLYDFGEANGWLYLVMPYLKGGSLKGRIAQGPLSARQAYGVVRRIAGALDKAHSKDIIHRDLKPGNILLDEEQEAYLSDFGIVKVAKGDTEYLTQTGQTIGTFAYMSPEQLMGEPLDGRSDLYALGIVLYEMLTGKHPYGDEMTTDAAMAVAHTQAPVPDVTKDNSALPPVFSEIIYKALAKDAGDRYATGRELAMAMYTALTGSKPAARAATAGAVRAAAATPAAPKPSSAAPAIDQPIVQPETRQPAREQPVPAAASPSAVVQESAPATPQAEVPQTAAPDSEAKKSPATATPLPRWIMVLTGLATFIIGGILMMNTWAIIEGYPVFYWLFIGLLTGVSTLSRPADWRWRLAVGILGIFGFMLAFVNSSSFWPVGIVGIIIGVIQVIQTKRGAGMALAALGAASLILGLATVANPRGDGGLLAGVVGLIVLLCGIVAIVLAFREGRSAS